MAENPLARIETAMKKMDETLSSFSLLAPSETETFMSAMKYAIVAKQLGEILTDEVMALAIMPLKDKGFGFKTDEYARTEKGKPPYSIAAVRNVIIEATMRGLRPINNEFNIIAGQCYSAKNGVKSQCRKIPGLTDLVLHKGIPRNANGGCLVDMTAEFKLKGKPMKLERKGVEAIAVRLVGDQGADAALGKAERKMLNYVFETVTGSEQSCGDVDDQEGDNLRTVTATVVDEDLTTTTPEPEKTEAPKQSQSQNMADKLKQAKVSVTKNGVPVNKPGITTPPITTTAPAAEVPQDPPADETPAADPPANGMSEASKALMAKAEKTLADAKAAGIKVGANVPMIVDGKVNHRNLNPDGTLKTEPPQSAAVPTGVPTSGTPVTTQRKPDGYQFVNGVKTPIYNEKPGDKPGPAATTEKQAAKPQKQPPGAPDGSIIPMVTQPPPPQGGELLEDHTVIESAQIMKRDENGVVKQRVKLVSSTATVYLVGDLKDRAETARKIGERSSELKQKKEKAVITYYKVDNDYWVYDVQKFVETAPEPEAEPAGVTDEDLDNFGAETDQQT